MKAKDWLKNISNTEGIYDPHNHLERETEAPYFCGSSYPSKPDIDDLLQTWCGKKVIIGFKCVDYDATVYIVMNDSEITADCSKKRLHAILVSYKISQAS